MLLQLTFFLLYSIAIANSQSIIEAAPLEDGDERTTLKCHQRTYLFNATKFDENGNGCWDILSVNACWGRCLTTEIGDFRFPFKKSIHPICVHFGRNKVFAILRNCNEGALPSAARYEYYEAENCKCQQCSSLDTSCEGPRYRAQRSQAYLGGFTRILRDDEEFY